MNNKNKTAREKIIESSVVISGILIFFGFLKQYWYYSSFDIPIHQYLSLDEILILFFAELAYICKLLLWASIYILFLVIIEKIINWIWGKKIISSTEISNDKDAIGGVMDNVLKNKKVLVGLFVFSFVLAIGGFFWFYYTNSITSIIYFALISCQTALLFFEWINDGIETEFSIIILVVVGLSVLLICKNNLDINRTKTQYDEYTYTLEMKDKNIKTSKDTLYLGKTKGFIFLYNNINSESIIFKNKNVNVYKKKKKK